MIRARGVRLERYFIESLVDAARVEVRSQVVVHERFVRSTAMTEDEAEDRVCGKVAERNCFGGCSLADWSRRASFNRRSSAST